MSDLSAKFTALETQLATQQTALLGALTSLGDTLGLINTALDTLNNNGAVNTKYLLAAIGANSPCAPCPTPPLVIPPVGTTEAPIDADKCQRSQAFIAFMQQAFTVLDVASAVGVGFSPSLVTDAFNQVIAGLSGGDSPDAISWPEAIQLVGDLISYVATNLTVGGTLSGSFAPMVLELRDAMYITVDAADAKAAYDSVVDSSGAGEWVKPVLKDAAYGAAYTYFFDPASSPDLSGFDGGACSLPAGTCFEVDFTQQHFSNGTNPVGVAVPIGPFNPVTSINTSSGTVTSDIPAFFAGDLTGWTLEMLDGDTLVNYRSGDLSSSGFINTSSLYAGGGGPVALPAGTGCFFFNGATGARGRFCSPA